MAWLCRQLGVARRGYYPWRQRQEEPGKRAAEQARLTVEIQALFEEHRGSYGSPRIHQELRAAGRRVGRHRVARLMQGAELKAQDPQTVPALLQGQQGSRWGGGEPPAAELPALGSEPLLGW